LRPERDTPNRFFVPNVEMYRSVNAVAEFCSVVQVARSNVPSAR
jgi:hypothetical protein